MNAITPFLFDDNQILRTIDRDGDPWFVAVDVCRCLGIKQTTYAVENLDEDEKGVGSTHTLGDQQDTTIVSESGLYTIILRSRKATTPGTVQHRFRKWVTGEVLPTIRKTGSYGQQKQSADLAAHRHAEHMFDRIRRETEPAIRQSLHAMLDQTLSAIGIPTPPLSAIGADAVPPALIAAPFWRALDALDAKGIAYDHARAPERIAISLRHLESLFAHHGGGVAMTGSLRRALKQSTAPRFIAIKAVNSILTGRTVKCWVWERPHGTTCREHQ